MLANLKRAKFLKIDGDLVKDINVSKTAENIVKSIVIFSKGLNLNLVFEHISDESILKRVKEILKEFKIEKAYGQGYLFAKPQLLV